jgi:hypothetical protein
MKITNCYIERTYNLGNFESRKVGFEAILSDTDQPLEVTACLEMLAHQHHENMVQKVRDGTAITQTAAKTGAPSQTVAAPNPHTPQKPQNPPLIWEPQKPTTKGPWDKCIQIMNASLIEIINQLTDHTFYSDDGFTYWLLTDQDNKENVKGVGRRAKA